MTPRQREQWNRMREALRLIAFEYSTPEQLHRASQKLYGLDGDEAIEAAYENIQQTARDAVKGVRQAMEAMRDGGDE